MTFNSVSPGAFRRYLANAPALLRRELALCENTADVARYLETHANDEELVWRYRLVAAEGRFLTEALVAELSAPTVSEAVKTDYSGAYLAYNPHLAPWPVVRPFVTDCILSWRQQVIEAEDDEYCDPTEAGWMTLVWITALAARGLWRRRDDPMLAEEIDEVADGCYARHAGMSPAGILSVAFWDAPTGLIEQSSTQRYCLGHKWSILAAHPKQTAAGLDALFGADYMPFFWPEAASWLSQITCRDVWTDLLIRVSARSREAAPVFVAHEPEAVVGSLEECFRRAPEVSRILLDALPSNTLLGVGDDVLRVGLLCRDSVVRQRCLLALGEKRRAWRSESRSPAPATVSD